MHYSQPQKKTFQVPFAFEIKSSRKQARLKFDCRRFQLGPGANERTTSLINWRSFVLV